MLKSFTCFYHAYIFRCRVQLFFVGKRTFCVNFFGRTNSKGFFHQSFVLFEIWSEHSGTRILLRGCLDVEHKLNLPPPLVTLLAEPFLTVHMLCTEKRLCTNPVKFLLHAQRVAKTVSNPGRIGVHFSQSPFAGPFAAIFTCFRRAQFRSSVSSKN